MKVRTQQKIARLKRKPGKGSWGRRKWWGSELWKWRREDALNSNVTPIERPPLVPAKVLLVTAMIAIPAIVITLGILAEYWR